MRHFSPEVRKVGHRLGTLEAPWIGRLPNLPNLPNLFPRVCACASVRRCGRTCAYARALNTNYVGKVRKVRKNQSGRGFQGSQPLPYLSEVRNP